MTGLVSRIGQSLRQRRYHRAFRIAAPAWDATQCGWLEQVIAALVAAENQPPPAVPDTPTLDDAALADAATNLWRAQRQLSQGDGGQSREVRLAGRYLRTTYDALGEAGLIIQDHDRAEFHPGQSLKVEAVLDDPSLSTETVVDTIKPSIYYRDRRIQMGQVIVGRPAKQAPTREDDHA